MTSELETVAKDKERVVVFMSPDQIEQSERLARQMGWTVPELNRVAHQLGLNAIAESNNKSLVNKKLHFKVEVANLLEEMDVDAMKRAIAYLKTLKGE